MRVDLGERVEAETVGQREIQDHERGLARRQMLEALRQPVREMHREGCARVLGDHLADQASIAGVVLDEEDVMHASDRLEGE